jgi:uncharacterized protein YciI
MLFALVAYDRPNSVARRMEIRPDHLKFLDSLGDQLVLAGPFLADNGDAARAAFGRDPFVQGNLFDSVTIKPWRLGVNKTHK